MKANRKTVEQRVKRTAGMGVALVREAVIPIVEDLKDFVRSTVKSSESVLRKDISSLQVAVGEHSGMIKKLGADIQCARTDLKEDMHQMERRLSEKIDGHSARLDDHESRIKAIERVA